MRLLDRMIGSLSPSVALRRATRLGEQSRAGEAFPLFARAARAGIAEAEYRVGRCYLEGSGVPVSRVEGLRWLRRAAAKGHAEAQSLVAVLHMQGYGTSEDREGPLSERASASLFSKEEAGEPDFAAAEKWARRAADAGSASGQAVLAHILAFGPEPMRDREEAHHWYERSAEGDCPQGALGYGLSLLRTAQN